MLNCLRHRGLEMPTYKLVIDLQRENEKYLNLSVESDDITRIGRTRTALLRRFIEHRDMDPPKIRIYQDGREIENSYFEQEYSSALRKLPEWGSARRNS